MIVAGTGHRPEDSEDEDIVRTKARVALQYSNAKVFITGMAAGFDLWAGDEARLLGMELWCAKPWATHEPRKGDENLYETLIDYADKIITVTNVDKYPGPWVYPVRNKWMVDNCTHLLAYWSGKEKGGTYDCVKYAKSLGEEDRPLIKNIFNAPPF